jgi:hypothetical protein
MSVSAPTKHDSDSPRVDIAGLIRAHLSPPIAAWIIWINHQPPIVSSAAPAVGAITVTTLIATTNIGNLGARRRFAEQVANNGKSHRGAGGADALDEAANQ